MAPLAPQQSSSSPFLDEEGNLQRFWISNVCGQHTVLQLSSFLLAQLSFSITCLLLFPSKHPEVMCCLVLYVKQLWDRLRQFRVCYWPTGRCERSPCFFIISKNVASTYSQMLLGWQLLICFTFKFLLFKTCLKNFGDPKNRTLAVLG